MARRSSNDPAPDEEPSVSAVVDPAWTAVELQAARDREARILAAWPPDRAAAGLVRAGERLRSFFEGTRSHVDGTLPFAIVRGASAALRADPPTLLLKMETLSSASVERLEVVLPLEGGEPSCSCADGIRGRPCGHVPLAALLLLETLEREGSHLPAKVAELLETPSWRRTLQAIDRALLQRVAAAEGEVPQRLSWRVSTKASGAIALEPFWQRKLGGDRWSAGSAAGWSEAVSADCSFELDRRCIRSLFPDGMTRREPSASMIPHGLLALVGHDHVYLGARPKARVSVQEVPVLVRAEEREGGALELVATAGGAAMDPRELLAALDVYGRAGVGAILDEARLVCSVLRIDPRTEALLRVLPGRDAFFPPEAVEPLLRCAEALGPSMPLRLPASLMGAEIPPRDDVVIHVERLGAASFLLTVLVRPVAGGLAFPPGEGAPLAAGINGEERLFTRRSFDVEVRSAQRMLASLPSPGAWQRWGPFQFAVDDDAALDLLVHLAAREGEEGLTIEWAKEAVRISRPALASDLRIEIGPKRDWFGLDGGLEVDELKIGLAQAFDAARRGSRYAEVKPGFFVALADELRDTLSRLSERVSTVSDGIEFPLAAAPAVAALLDQGELRIAGELGAIFERIRLSRQQEIPLPASLRATLRPYQVEGFQWLARLASWGAGGCLADDMGLGKTLQALALLLSRAAEGPALVLAPTSVCSGWRREAERFAPALRPIVYGALSDDERERLSLGPGDLLILSYGHLSRDVEQLAAHRFSTLVIDEAQAIKNPQTLRHRAVRRLNAQVRIALSGTPFENHLGELWSLYQVLLPGLLGDAESFRDRFVIPIERDRDPARRQALIERIRPFLLRRTKEEVARELPARTEIDVPIHLSVGERKLYDEARIAAAAQIGGDDRSLHPEQQRFQILAALTRLRLCACHPRLYEKSSTLPSSKLERLIGLLLELREGGHRALVFSQFTSQLDLAEEALAAAEIRSLRLDGSTPAARRQPLVDAWQTGDQDAFLISLQAGGTGLNLTGADYVIHLDPWWNPAVEDQASDRAHRIGQQRPVTVLRLIAMGTIEEQILSLHAQKRELIDAVLRVRDEEVHEPREQEASKRRRALLRASQAEEIGPASAGAISSQARKVDGGAAIDTAALAALLID